MNFLAYDMIQETSTTRLPLKTNGVWLIAYTLISTTVGSEHIFAFKLGKYTYQRLILDHCNDLFRLNRSTVFLNSKCLT